jgi:hypothetical protein
MSTRAALVIAGVVAVVLLFVLLRGRKDERAGAASTAQEAPSAAEEPSASSPPPPPTPEPRAPRPLPPPRFSAPVAAVPAGPPDASARGTLPKDEIRAAIGAAAAKVQACYDEAFKRDPGISGRLAVSFTIRDQGGVGRVSEAAVVPRQRDGGVPELTDLPTQQCILNVVAASTFPPPVGGPVTVTYPFVMAPAVTATKPPTTKPTPDGALSAQ